QLYSGETAAETLARVIEREPDIDALPSSTPPPIRELVRRCLTKEPRSRLQAIGEARIAIDQASSNINDRDISSERPATAPVLSPSALPWVLAGLAIAVATGLLVESSPWRRPPPQPPLLRLNVALGADISLVWTDDLGAGASAVLSADGTILAFVGQKLG